MNGQHPQQQYPRFPAPPQQQQQQQQQQQAHQQEAQNSSYGGYSTTAAPPYHTVQYTYPTPLTGLQRPQQHPQPQPSQYFQALPQGAPTTTRRRQPSQKQRQQSTPQPPTLGSLDQHNGRSSLPCSPGNGPGAPPPERNSPPPGFEEELMNALQNRTDDGDPPAATRANDEDEDDDDQDVVDEDEPVYQLPPPPENEYADEVELEKAIHAWSLEHGYELVRRASKKNAKGQLYKRYYHCSKHGRVSSNKTPEKDKVRVNRKSNRIGCPMSLAAVSVNPHDPTGNWQIRLRKAHHNHPAVEANELAGHRRRARFGAVEKAVDGLFAINTSTNDVLKFLQRTQPEGLFKRTDVANMKLKFKKHGTCANQAESGHAEVTPQTTPSAAQKGFPSACNTCRGRKSKCDSQRPNCGSCLKSGAVCTYDHVPTSRSSQQQPLPPAPPNRPQQQTPTASSARARQPQRQALAGAADDDVMQIDPPQPNFQIPPDNGHMNPMNQATSQAAQAQQVFAAIAAFQQEHITPTRLDLNSSAVEVLASSTCGNGDSYRSAIPQYFSIGGDWKKYKEAFESAAVKENCVDVLLGHKKEPDKPKPAEGEAGIEVEVHNEYIKQLAIFKRRNEMLKQGLRDTLAPALWNRVKPYHNASGMWTALEDMCCPRGSDQAYARFNDILYVTLANCGGNLDHYIHTIELKWTEFNELANTHESRRSSSQLNMSAAEVLKRKVAGNGTIPEEMLCFLFLRNLGPQHQNLAANMCVANNIGGFGSGERCGFRGLCAQVKRRFEP
ncbi:putative zn(2)-C6 fungal-type DNA-binding domain, FAR1 DNA binding domain-containing protein [Septoria linicola]|nr:putative zn(2)-C6 fungal-type DNA-binding domain, FAR1 DNA binding domain-containing protein [Septoria linicola]